MRTEISFQNFNENEKKKLLGLFHPKTYSLNNTLLSAVYHKFARSQAMRTEASFQNLNEKEKKKIFGSISAQKTYCLNKSLLSKVVQIHAWTPTGCRDFSEVITKATQGQQNERRFVWLSFSKNTDCQELISEN